MIDIVVYVHHVKKLNDNNLNVNMKKEIIDWRYIMNVMVNGNWNWICLEFNQSFDDVPSHGNSRMEKKKILKVLIVIEKK